MLNIEHTSKDYYDGRSIFFIYKGMKFRAFLFYDKGGYSYVTYKHMPRCYRLVLNCCEYGIHPEADRLILYHERADSGFNYLIESTTRFSKKAFENLCAEYLSTEPPQIVINMLENILDTERSKVK